MTTTTKPFEVVLKTDSRGRVRTPAERREQLLDEFERSGLSGVKFAALTGLKYQTLASWVQRRRWLQGSSGKAAAKREAQVRWLEAVVAEAQPAATVAGMTLKVHLPHGAWTEVADAQQAVLVAALLRALEPSC
jgi:hypothetical protein